MENATKATLTNVVRRAFLALNNTASHFAAHPTTTEAVGVPISLVVEINIL